MVLRRKDDAVLFFSPFKSVGVVEPAVHGVVAGGGVRRQGRAVGLERRGCHREQGREMVGTVLPNTSRRRRRRRRRRLRLSSCADRVCATDWVCFFAQLVLLELLHAELGPEAGVDLGDERGVGYLRHVWHGSWKGGKGESAAAGEEEEGV